MGTDVSVQSTVEERAAVARDFITRNGLFDVMAGGCFVDTFGDDCFEEAYKAWPDKTVVIRDGVVVFDSERWADGDWSVALPEFLATGAVTSVPRSNHERLVVEPIRPAIEAL